jgi:hypothetical protein
MLAYFAGGEETPSRALTQADYAILGAISLVGLAAAWKWERLGASVALAAVGVGALFNWHFITFPLVLIPLSALLFLLCAWLKKNDMSRRAEPPGLRA